MFSLLCSVDENHLQASAALESSSSGLAARRKGNRWLRRAPASAGARTPAVAMRRCGPAAESGGCTAHLNAPQRQPPRDEMPPRSIGDDCSVERTDNHRPSRPVTAMAASRAAGLRSPQAEVAPSAPSACALLGRGRHDPAPSGAPGRRAGGGSRRPAPRGENEEERRVRRPTTPVQHATRSHERGRRREPG